MTGKFSLTCEVNGVSRNANYPLSPEQIETNEVKRFGFIPQNATEVILKAVVFANTDELRPNLTTVHLKDGFVNATDSHCLLFERCEGLETNEFMMIVKSAIKLMDGKSDYTVYTVGDKNYKLASSDGYEIIFRKMEGNYPNVNAIVPSSFNTEVTLNKKDFVNKITEAKICENQASNRQDFKLDVAKKSLTVSSQDIDFGQSYYSTLPVEPVSGEDIEIGFKSDLLLKALKHDPKKDDVTFKFVDSSRCCVIDGKILVMPMKIS